MPKKTKPKPSPHSPKRNKEYPPVASELLARAVEAMIAWRTGKVKAMPRNRPIFATVDDDGAVQTYTVDESDPSIQMMRAINGITSDPRTQMAIHARCNAMAELLGRPQVAGVATASLEPMALLFAAAQTRLLSVAPPAPSHFDEAEFVEMYRKALPF